MEGFNKFFLAKVCVLVDVDKPIITDMLFPKCILDRFWGFAKFVSKLGHDLSMCNDYEVRNEKLIFGTWLGTEVVRSVERIVMVEVKDFNENMMGVKELISMVGFTIFCFHNKKG